MTDLTIHSKDELEIQVDNDSFLYEEYKRYLKENSHKLRKVDINGKFFNEVLSERFKVTRVQKHNFIYTYTYE